MLTVDEIKSKFPELDLAAVNRDGSEATDSDLFFVEFDPHINGMVDCINSTVISFTVNKELFDVNKELVKLQYPEAVRVSYDQLKHLIEKYIFKIGDALVNVNIETSGILTLACHTSDSWVFEELTPDNTLNIFFVKDALLVLNLHGDIRELVPYETKRVQL